MRTLVALVAVAAVACQGDPLSHAALPADFQPASIAIGDFNGDGKIDVAVAGESQRLIIFLGDGRGGLRAAAESAKVGEHPGAMAAADVNGDGKTDLVVANHDTDHLTILINDGGARFSARTQRVPSKPHPHMIAAADVSGDGHVDLITDSFLEKRLLVLLGDGGGWLPGPPVTVGRKPYFTLSVADLDADGALDIVVPNQGEGTVSILRGDGKSHFAHAAQSPIAAGEQPFSAAIGDFNGDGRPDIAIANYSGHITDTARDGITWIRNGGNGHFTAFPARVMRGEGSARMAAGDFNGDGFADVAISNTATNTVSVAFGSREGLRAGVTLRTMPSPHALAFADLDGDGRAELLVVAENASQMVVLRSSAGTLP